MMALHAGANDLGSVMIEENVVSAAGSSGMYSAEELQSIIAEAGFTPQLRDQKYDPVNR
jgi:cyclic dehypoxanthinyl futalosine synthase